MTGPIYQVRVPAILYEETLQAIGSDSFHGTFPAGSVQAHVLQVKPNITLKEGKVLNALTAQVEVRTEEEVLGTFPVTAFSNFSCPEAEEDPTRVTVDVEVTATQATAVLSEDRSTMTITVRVEHRMTVAKLEKITLRGIGPDGAQDENAAF